MANFIYDKAREKFLNGEISWSQDEIRIALVNDKYTQNQLDHISLNDIKNLSGESAIITNGISEPLGGKTITNGIAGANDITLNNIPSGNTIKSIIIYRKNQNESTDLIAFIDTGTGVDGGLKTTGNQITISWNNGLNKIFKL